MKRRAKLTLGGMGLLMASCAAWCVGVPCVGAWARWGMVIDDCPDGRPLLSARLSAGELERGQEAWFSLDVEGRYLHEGGYEDRAPLRRFSAELSVVTPAGERALDCDWDEAPGAAWCRARFPEDIPDGDHKLRAVLSTPLSDAPAVIEADLPLYRPALVHLLSDRPLYQPGDTLRLRSLTLARGSLVPIDDRPGTWFVRSPLGEVLLEERSPGGAWGVAETSFPLPPDAETGPWTVEWRSGDDSATLTLDVRPFTLPRFTVEVQAEDPWTGEGEAPAVSGVVRYTSGAPVADAAVELKVKGDGPWPPPPEWEEPRVLTTDAAGRFRVVLPEVPADLVGQSALRVSVVATDASGESQRAAARVLLSEDPLAVDAVTELGEGGALVSDFNNRVWLRVTTPDGRALAGETVRVRNRWDPRDEGRALVADEDGVVAFQIDPGQPVSVEHPAQPLRPPPEARVQPLALRGTKALLGDRALRLGERAALDEGLRRASACAIKVGEAGAHALRLVAEGGVVREAIAPEIPAVRCVGEAMVGVVTGEGDEVYELSLALTPDRALPSLEHVAATFFGPPLPEALVEAAVDEARACATALRSAGALPERLLWRRRAGLPGVELRWVTDPDGGMDGGLMPCVRRAFEVTLAGLPFAGADAMGRVSLTGVPPAPPRAAIIPSPTVTPGYELLVEVEGVGGTTWRAPVGDIPALRLRPDRVLLDVGDELSVDLLRGPDFRGELPDDLTLRRGDTAVQRCPRTAEALDEAREGTYAAACPAPDPQGRRVAFRVEHEGFHEVTWQGARAVVYVRPKATLGLTLTSDAAVYAPGATARIEVRTTQPAVVSLVGVDEALGQLAALPAPGQLGELVVTARSDAPAFGLFDATALATGRVRGENAAMAAVQRVTVLGSASPIAPPRSVEASHEVDEIELLDAVFYEVFVDARRAVRAWEAGAPEGELLSNEQMAALWEGVLDAREDAELPVTDAFGRRLELTLLPTHHLDQVEPRRMVADGTRIPEDIEPWRAWVATER